MPFLENNAVQLLTQYLGMSAEQAAFHYRKTTGLPFVQQMEIISPNSSSGNSKIVEKFEKMKIDRIYEQHPFQETPFVLEELNTRGYCVGISSGTYEEIIRDYLDLKGLSHFIHDILGWRPGFEKGKDHFEYIMNQYNLKPDQLIFVGDSLNDAKRSLSNDIYFIARKGMFRAEDFERVIPNVLVVDSLSELLDLLPPINLGE